METRSAQELRQRLAALLGHRQSDPGNVSLACDVVNLQLKLGETTAAQALLDELLARNPAEPALRFLQSSVALAVQDYPAAEQVVAALMAEGHDGLALRYNRAQALLWLRRPEEAIQLLQPAAAQAGEYPHLLMMLARAYQQREEVAPAIGVVREYLKLQPNDAEGHGLLALLFVDSGRYGEAAVSCEQALKLDPEQLDALLAHGRLALNRLDYAGAAESMRRAVGRYPTSGAAWSALAQAELLRVDLPAAEAALEQALTHMPEHIGTWHLKAWCQILCGDAAGAKRSFASAYEIDRNFGETHGGLAVVAAMQGDEGEARAAMKRALRLNPQGMAARYAESLLLERAGKADEAKAVVQEVLSRTSPTSGMSYLQMVAANRAKLEKA